MNKQKKEKNLSSESEWETDSWDPSTLSHLMLLNGASPFWNGRPLQHQAHPFFKLL